MSARIPVALTRNPYEVIVGHDVLPRCGELIAQILSPRKCALISDSNVTALYGDTVEAALQQAGFAVTRIAVPAGETSKSLRIAEEICDQMIEAGLDRHSFVAGLGGGVVGDLSGLVAALYFRGVPHIQIPTSVVAQVDSAIGGKTGVNSSKGKNLIGAFHQPALVLADVGTLDTLPAREFNEGFAEIIKHAAIRDATMIENAVDVQKSNLAELILRNVQIKAMIVAEDEFEQLGVRALLNFGHTIGHAIENIAGYGRYLHGEAISMGLAAALHLSVQKAGLDSKSAAKVIAALRAFELPTRIPEDLSTDALIAALQRDKKFESGAIRFVLVPELGTAIVSKEIVESDLRTAIDAIRA